MVRRRFGPGAEAEPFDRGRPVVDPESSWVHYPIRIPADFASMMPSIGEFLDHVAQNFFGFHRKSHGPYQRLGVEVVLSPAEARSGCRVPIEVPNFEPCLRCGGLDAGWAVCRLCHGYGLAEATARVVMEIPPGTKGGARYQVSLARAGIAKPAA